MHDISVCRQLHDAVDTMLDREPLNSILRTTPPFDVTQPTEHANKKEFKREKNMVVKGRKHLIAFINLFYFKEMPEEHIVARDQLLAKIDSAAVSSAVNEEINSIQSLLYKNALETGFFLNTWQLILRLHSDLVIRQKELEDVEKEFWSTPNRPPNYYARTIALRLARILAIETGNRPTFGTSRDGGHPSTKFARALETVFEILNIDADIRAPAKWAIEQITDDDIEMLPVGGLGKYFTISGEPRSNFGQPRTLGEFLKSVPKGGP